jgi:hypothetical protein
VAEVERDVAVAAFSTVTVWVMLSPIQAASNEMCAGVATIVGSPMSRRSSGMASSPAGTRSGLSSAVASV